MKAYAILLCAGSGSRMRAGENKIFLEIDGKPAVLRALESIAESGCFIKTVIAAKSEEISHLKDITRRFEKDVIFCEGGEERQDSVYNALKLVPDDADVISIHDAARCFTSPALIKKCVESAEKYGSGAAGRRCTDTVKRVEGEEIISTLDRNSLVLIETPQAFDAKTIKDAYQRAQEEGIKATDDCSLLEAMGLRPRVVLHDEINLKLTYRSDLERMGVSKMNIRTGFGFDAHRLTENRRLILGGVDIPHEKGLLGHSDADVLTHAIMDALLGAATLGDIGKLFPDNDEKYKDADSIKLLEEVGNLLSENGYSISNVDCTVSAQRPKLRAYIDEMRKNVASALKIDQDRVSVKATTTERMGYEGREEGISAYAVATVTGK